MYAVLDQEIGLAQGGSPRVPTIRPPASMRCRMRCRITRRWCISPLPPSSQPSAYWHSAGSRWRDTVDSDDVASNGQPTETAINPLSPTLHVHANADGIRTLLIKLAYACKTLLYRHRHGELGGSRGSRSPGRSDR